MGWLRRRRLVGALRSRDAGFDQVGQLHQRLFVAGQHGGGSGEGHHQVSTAGSTHHQTISGSATGRAICQVGLADSTTVK